VADSNLKFNVLVSAQTEALLKLAEVVDRLSAKLDELDRKKVNVPVDADTAKADAKLAETKKQADALDGKNINIKVDSSQVDQASERMSRMQMIAIALVAAFPAIAAAVLALPAALSLVAAPIAAIVLGMDGIKAAVQPLSTAFGDLKTQVSEVFAGQLQPAVRNLALLFPTLTTGLQGTAQALSNVATQVTSVVSSSAGLDMLKGIFQGVNDLISNMAPGIAQFTDNILNLAQSGIQGLQPFAEVFNQVADAWKNTIADMAQTGTVQAAISGLVQVLGGLLNILPPLVELGAKFMAAVGPPLAAALNAVASVLGVLAGPLGNVTVLVLEAVAAWKLLSLAGNAFASLGTKLGGAVGAMGNFASASKLAAAEAGGFVNSAGNFVVASKNAATGATGLSGAATKVGSALSKIGSALPVVGLAFVALNGVVDAANQKWDANVQATLQGGKAAQTAKDQMTSGIPGIVNLGLSLLGLNSGYEGVSQAATDYYNQQSLLGKAQIDATKAQNDYDLVLQDSNSTTQQVAEAHQRLTDAVQKYKDAEVAATDATKSGADALHEHIGTISGLINAHQAYGAALKATAKATDAYNAALKSGDQDLIAQKTEILVGAIDDQATALANQAKVATQSLGPTASLAEQNRAYVNSLGDSAATLQGPARTALLGYIDTLSNADLATISSANHVSGLKTQIITLPSGRKVEIAVDAQAALDQVANIKKQITEITSTVHQVTMGLITTIAEGLLGGFKGKVDNTHGTAHVDGESSGGTTVLEAWKALVGGTTATAHQTSEPAGAQSVLSAWIALVGGTTATGHQNAEPAGANSILAAWVARVFGTTATGHQNADPALANAALAAWVARVFGTTATAKANADTSQAESMLNYVARARTAIINIQYTGGTGTGASTFGLAQGGVITPMAAGGVVGFDRGGLASHKLTAMSGGAAQVVPPNTWRLIGDNMKVPEVFAPLDGSDRSLSFLRYGANQFGFDLAPLQAAVAGQYTPKATPAYATQLPRGTQGATTYNQQVTVVCPNNVNMMDAASRRQLAVFVKDELTKLDSSRR
jgi:hypothetical protein